MNKISNDDPLNDVENKIIIDFMSPSNENGNIE